MVIGVAGVARDGASGGFGAMVADGEGDDGAGFGEDLGGVDAFEGVFLEPRHFAVVLAGEPGLEFFGGGGSLGGGDAAIVEAEFEGAGAEAIFHCG